ncbi:hypothetical protein V1511DRAFT_462980, partial [Dipodascopsis uninucleata]
MLEQKRHEHELLRLEHIRRFEHEMHLLEEQHRKDEQMILQMAANNDIDAGANTSTTISEPNTPPDYRESQQNGGTGLSAPGAAGDRIRSNTVPVGVSVGVSGLVSTPSGNLGRLGQSHHSHGQHHHQSSSSSSLMTPPDDGTAVVPRVRTLTTPSLGASASTSHNVGEMSRRLSIDDPLLFDLPKLSLSRPESSHTRSAQQSGSDTLDSPYLNQTSKFLFGSDVTAGSSGSELKFNTTNDKFPILVRRESFNSQSQSGFQQHHHHHQQQQQQQQQSQPQQQQQPQQSWSSFMSRPRGAQHSHSLSGVSYPSPMHPDSAFQKDKRQSMEFASAPPSSSAMPNSYQLFN